MSNANGSVITILSEEKIAFDEFAYAMDGEGSVLRLGNDMDNSIILYRHEISRLILNENSIIDWACNRK